MKHIVVTIEVTEDCEYQKVTLVDMWREKVSFHEIVEEMKYGGR
jgi:hypothetical protein